MNRLRSENIDYRSKVQFIFKSKLIVQQLYTNVNYILLRQDFIMQNRFVKKVELFFTVTAMNIKRYRKNSK
jgi:hypothetical protein